MKWETDRNKKFVERHENSRKNCLPRDSLLQRVSPFIQISLCSEWILPSSFPLFNWQIPYNKLSVTICYFPSVLTERTHRLTPSCSRGYRFHITPNSMIHQFKLSGQTTLTNSEICNLLFGPSWTQLQTWTCFKL